jgi:hypothetical protein
MLHPLFVVVLCFFSGRTLRDVVSNDKFFGVLRRSCQASFPTPYLPIGYSLPICVYALCFMLALCSDALFESRILSTYFPQSKTIFLPPPAYYLLFVVWVGLASLRHAYVVSSCFIFSGCWKVYHMPYLIYEMDMNWRLVGYKMLEINMIYLCYNYTWLSRGIGESFCLFSDGSLVSPRTPSSHELF